MFQCDSMHFIHEEHDALAREVARDSVVLLKNDGSILPMKKSGQKIALIG